MGYIFENQDCLAAGSYMDHLVLRSNLMERVAKTAVFCGRKIGIDMVQRNCEHWLQQMNAIYWIDVFPSC